MRVFKLISILTGAVVCATLGAAQSSFDLALESSSMPTVASPVIGNGFYSPGSIFQAEYTTVVVKETTDQVQNDRVLPKITTSETITQEKKFLASLTAEELSQMEKQGLLKSEMDSLLGDNYAVRSTQEAKKLLDEALFEIEEIREREVPAKTTSKKEISQVSSLNPHSKVIRFYVNGEDILKTCRTIYISDVQADGSFLVTGDRIYSSDGKDRKETFHLIFKASFDKTENTNYTAAAAITQDSTNENSFLYQLANKNDLCAQRVGNFVAMRSDESELKIEFLVDLGEE